MNTKNLSALLMLILCFPVARLLAKGHTPIETFIRQTHETTPFVPVNNIWRTDVNFDKKAMLEKVEKAQPLTIDYAAVADLMKQKHTAIELTIPAVDGGAYTIELARYDFLSNDFQVHTLDGAKDEVYNYTPGVYYSGIVKGIPGSIASFSFFNNEVYGLFSIPNEGNYNLVPNVMVGKYYDSNPHYILYNEEDLKIKSYAPHCDNDQLPYMHEEAAASKTTTYVGNNVYRNCKEIRVFEVGDYAMYHTKSSSVTNVTNYLTALFNNQNLLYRNEGVPIVLGYVQVNTATDNYQHITASNSSYFLDTFGKVTQNTLHSCDVAMLASTALNGGYGALGGVAWLQALCATYHASNFFGPYGFCDMDNSNVTNFPTFSWDVEVITHEMGHIVGSPHTHACVWNPPARNTAIDSCYTLEGTCHAPVPAFPVAKGTIMSYCHLVSGVGIILSNGFGPQPGDTIRTYISNKFAGTSTCGAIYNPSVALTNVARTVSANRECQDVTGITYYWNDNNTADHADDTLILMVNKNGNNIGSLDSAGFSVTTATLPLYGSGRGDTMSLPTGITGIFNKNIAMRRYWSISASIAPTSAVEVMFPFTKADSTDVDGSVAGATPLTSFLMYRVNSPIDPNPANNFPGATGSSFTIYTYGASASATNWSLSNVGTTYLAHMKMTTLKCGGSGFYSYQKTAVASVNGANSGVSVYPNPAHDQWFVSVDRSTTEVLSFQLYATDGRIVASQILNNDAINTINAADLAPGMYFYRITGESDVFTGNVIKR